MGIYIRDKKNGIYWIRFQLRDKSGQTRRVHESSGFDDKIKAQECHDRKRLEILDEIRLGRKPEYRWEEAAGEWLRQMAHKRSIDKDREVLVWLHPHLAGAPLVTINRDRLEALRQRKARETSPATANRYMALVRAILNKAAYEWGMLDKAPKVPMFRESSRRVFTLTRQQAEALLAELPAHLSTMARFTLETGLRRHNVTHLRWNQIDMENRAAWIHPEDAKGKRAIPVPLTEAALSVLRVQVGQHPEYVFTYRGAPVYQTTTKAWRNAVKRAGLPPMRWHDLRHVWASWQAQSGTPLLALQELGGWQSSEMVRRYAHFAIDHLRDYAERASGGAAHRLLPQSNVVPLKKAVSD